ncbi:MAG: multiubiquitin domain-containing protein [Humidesulfovibrio sp.]|uniref:multiubiquitin domain-containing protein n=1 Tax=Humidesulfovibrio sp. TaxID=2910988 RepID=UPI002736C7F3|nr:multiubiquitin domain-containing protein [Humidesulfovibrio sp.]MDP2846816.1 multiubiquitin domain-containing protein [Humidesulfovibrio sp.]
MEYHDKLPDTIEEAGKHHEAEKPHSHPPGGFRIQMAEEDMLLPPITVEQSNPTGLQILTAAGCTPPEDHALIQLLRPGTRLVGLDDQVSLREQEECIFRAFRGGEVFLLTIDGHGYEWGAPEISEKTLHYVSAAPEEMVFVMKDGDRECEIKDGESVRLSHAGIEHLHTRPRMVTVTLDGEEKTIPAGVYTTEELLNSLGVEPGYLLNVMKGDQLITLRPNERLHVKDGMVFISQVPGGASS